jgi:hypothetical protein
VNTTSSVKWARTASTSWAFQALTQESAKWAAVV